MYRKRGFTQGAPSSPILCNYALEFAGLGRIGGLIQYADDGVILRDSKEDLKILDDARSRLAGVKIATNKPLGWTINFEFLGLKFHTVNKTIESKDGESINYMTASYKELISFLKRYGEYGSNKAPLETKRSTNQSL